MKQKTDAGDPTNEPDHALRVAFEALAMKRPHEGGARMPEDLAIWLLEEFRHLPLPAPPMIQKVLLTVSQVLEAMPPPVSPVSKKMRLPRYSTTSVRTLP